MTPVIFGFPLWRGKIKRRVAKKYLRRYCNGWMMKPRAQREFSKLGVGDVINDCTNKNGKILEMSATYRRVGAGKGAILLDVDFQTTNTGCSLCHCGIEPQQSREEIEQRMLEHAKNWALDDSGKPGTAKYWYGKDEKTYLAVVAYAKKVVATLESGGHVTDEAGFLLDEFKFETPKDE